MVEQPFPLETCVLELRAAKNGTHYKLLRRRRGTGEFQAAEDSLSDEGRTLRHRAEEGAGYPMRKR